MSTLALFLLILGISLVRSLDHGSSLGNECVHNKHHQSPIDIETDSLKECPRDVGLIDFGAYNHKVKLEAVNTGHSVDFVLHTDDIKIRSGGLMGPYTLAQFHFHWGATNIQGAEHTVDGKTYALEVHFVHKGERQTDEDKHLAVVGVMFEVGKHNSALQQLIDVFEQIKHPQHDKVYVPEFKLSTLLPHNRAFYRYQGSLTTPPCTETVVWSVMKQIVQVSQQQLSQFRGLLDQFEHHIHNNNRDVQQLGDRFVYCCNCDCYKDGEL